jgi:hypothetical protein
LIDLVVTEYGRRQVVATFDGRCLCVELVGSFTGSVVGAYAAPNASSWTRSSRADL